MTVHAFTPKPKPPKPETVRVERADGGLTISIGPEKATITPFPAGNTTGNTER